MRDIHKNQLALTLCFCLYLPEHLHWTGTRFSSIPRRLAQSSWNIYFQKFYEDQLVFKVLWPRSCSISCRTGQNTTAPLWDKPPCFFFFFTEIPKAVTLPLALCTRIWLQSCYAYAELAAQQRWMVKARTLWGYCFLLYWAPVSSECPRVTDYLKYIHNSTSFVQLMLAYTEEKGARKKAEY